jgi:hypothetical protein
MRYTRCEMISLRTLLYIIARQNGHCASSKENDNGTRHGGKCPAL